MANTKAALKALQVAVAQCNHLRKPLDKFLKAVSKNERNIKSKMLSISNALTDI